MRRGTASISRYKSEHQSSSLQNSFYRGGSPVNLLYRHEGASDMALDYQLSPTGEFMRNQIDRKRSSGQLSGLMVKPFAIQPEPAIEKKKDSHKQNSFDYEEKNEVPFLMGFTDGQPNQSIAMGIKAFLEKKREF